MKYRIVIETERSGDKHYYVQYKLLWFWLYRRVMVGYDGGTIRREYDTLKDAQDCINSLILAARQEELQEIVSREKIIYP